MNTIHIISDYNDTVIEYDKSHNRCLSDILRNNNVLVNTTCGGHGICKKCLVKITDSCGTSKVLACKYIPDSDLTVYIESKHSEENSKINFTNTVSSKIYAAVDIGSTGITICLCDDSEIIASSSYTNPTTAYGADVMSRISADCAGHGNEMSLLLRRSIYSHIYGLLEKIHIAADRLCRVVLSANNVMQHILLNLNMQSLASYPFDSENTSFDVYSFNKFFDCNMSCPAEVFIIPSFSSFIGGDIVSGIYSKNIHKSDNTFLFIDLGTNAEMVVGNSSHMLCTSAAAGPAFEASGLSCGCTYIPGAIYDTSINRSRVSYKTVNDVLPTGVCGSGALLLLSELINCGYVDSHGTFTDEYIDTGFTIAKAPGSVIKITQADIRNIQLAIAAIKTGINILLREYGITSDKINHVYVSGSFGSSLDFNRLKKLCLFPEEWIDSGIISVLDNTSLAGAVKCAREMSEVFPDFSDITNRMQELILAEHPLFNDTYMSAIDFNDI